MVNNRSQQQEPCNVDECQQKRYRDKLCVKHYQRRQTYGDPLAGPPFRRQYRLEKPTGCDIDECKRPHHSNGLCLPHWQRRQAYGDPLAGPPLRKQRGTVIRRLTSQSYSGELWAYEADAAYKIRHDLVKRWRGLARLYWCKCGKKAQAWATIHDTDGWSPDDYISLCHACHTKYDWNRQSELGKNQTKKRLERMRKAASNRDPVSDATRKKLSDNHRSGVIRPEVRTKIGAANRGKKRSEETKKKIGDANRGRKMSDAQKEKLRKIIRADPEKHRVSVLKGWETRRANQKKQTGGDDESNRQIGTDG